MGAENGAFDELLGCLAQGRTLRTPRSSKEAYESYEAWVARVKTALLRLKGGVSLAAQWLQLRDSPFHDYLHSMAVYNEKTLETHRIALAERMAWIERFLQPVQSNITPSRSGTQKHNVERPMIFIGHGRSHCWKDLRDLLRDRLELGVEEFNHVPTAGFTTVDRLRKMLESVSMAFIVLTGEDEHADGSKHARENVVHEAGLFQGRLGFERAILLVEDGCSAFSNIEGLTQIRFPKGDVLARAEDVRRVLEREGLLSTGKPIRKHGG